LLQMAKDGNARLDLWTFQANAQARRFYEHRGFRLVELTDGSANEEETPDARYRWVGD
jgi:putative acetyltransferase